MELSGVANKMWMVKKHSLYFSGFSIVDSNKHACWTSDVKRAYIFDSIETAKKLAEVFEDAFVTTNAFSSEAMVE